MCAATGSGMTFAHRDFWLAKLARDKSPPASVGFNWWRKRGGDVGNLNFQQIFPSVYKSLHDLDFGCDTQE